MPIATRTFRVFVSSTFEDLIEERNALQREVFPAFRQLCEAYGTRFQAIDLRWGGRDEAVLGQKMMEICLAEIERCQRTRIKPNFIVLLGDRYGKPPLPARVRESEFKAVLGRADSEEQHALIDNWYLRDENAVPAEYLLKPRTGEFVDGHRWKELEDQLGEALRRAARAAGLTRASLLKYEGSASRQEIEKGLGTTAEDRRHTFAFFRATDAAKEPVELKDLKNLLREQLKENVVEYSSGDIGKLCRDVRERLEQVIRSEISGLAFRSTVSPERMAHNRFACERRRHFSGRQPVLEAIAGYLKDTDKRPFVIHGASGCGKSAILAQSSYLAAAASRKAIIVRRFIGATPDASSGFTLPRGLCEEIAHRYGRPQEIPVDFNQLVDDFRAKLAFATLGRPLYLFLDGLDQLGPQDAASQLAWLPSELPPNSWVVVSTTGMPPALRNAKDFTVPSLPLSEADVALKAWLEDANRKLQSDQRAKVLDYFKRSGLPLYLRLAFEEARHWRSFDELAVCTLRDGLSGIVNVLFDRLSAEGNHGRVLVKRSLGYLAAARYGLTEDEILGSGANGPGVGDDGQMPRFVPIEELFKGRHFNQEIVVLCVRWYLSFKLSFRDLVAMMAERGIGMAHTTILRWVQHYTPEFEKRWKRLARPVGGSWRMDETYIRVKGEWVYLYRAVDKSGKTVDFYLSRKRDVNAAKAFLRKAMKDERIPAKITLDAYAASHRAVADLKENGELPKRVRVRTSKYLNNAIEQDHRRVKQRLRSMLGLKSFRTAAVVIGGIELAEKIKKGQFKLGKLGGRTATMPEIWQAALAA